MVSYLTRQSASAAISALLGKTLDSLIFGEGIERGRRAALRDVSACGVAGGCTECTLERLSSESVRAGGTLCTTKRSLRFHVVTKIIELFKHVQRAVQTCNEEDEEQK